MSFSLHRILYLLIFCFCGLVHCQSNAENLDKETAHLLFDDSKRLSVHIKCSKRQIKRETNDSTYIKTTLWYRHKDEIWDSIAVKMRARGNFRKKTCYFPPLKLKIKKSESKATVFENQKRLKVVLPCLNETEKNDDVIKEYLAYKLYEVITPYYFETRLLDINYEELRNRKSKIHDLKGFFIEDDSKVAERLGGKVLKRRFYPQGFDNHFAVRNAMFHFMIGNTDFSATYSHNCKAMYIDKKFVPVSYDFDMAGLVNTSYSVVSKTRRYELPIDHVTQRYYMGYKRDYKFFRAIREEFMSKKEQFLAVIDDHKRYFENPRNHKIARQYLESFFKLLEDENAFKRNTYDKALKM